MNVSWNHSDGGDLTYLVSKGTVTSNKNISSDSLSEHLDLEGIGNDLLSLSVNIGMDKRNVVVTGDDVSEGGETLLYTLNSNGRGKRVSQVLQLLVGGG